MQIARTAAKLSQKDLAQKVNVTPKTIQSYENGTAIPQHPLLVYTYAQSFLCVAY
uniref:HTH cro/C1-type domain-containing protein n=1 Tax=viral metagenome TaxID=1070528 RepID=A0A6C0JPR5_9ZZZZ